jgi:hypothetical protein
MAGPVNGECLCGAVRYRVARKPDYVNDCNCSLCRKSGALWAYYPSAEIEISGETTGFVRQDMREPALSVHHCPACGATTHWMPLGDGPHARMGVNARLFEDGAMDGVEIRYPDGRSWEG